MLYDNIAFDDDSVLVEDIPLTHADIQAISSLDEVIAFFTRLHYQTNDHLQQTPASLGIHTERLLRNIKHIERVALNSDFNPLSVYFFQVSSLSAGLRRDLVQQFRRLQGDFLLLLTDTFDQLYFLLLERYDPTIVRKDDTLSLESLSFTSRSENIRERSLLVERLNPNEVALRVLRRFTYTETDTIAQYEKLLSAFEIATWSELYFNNRALFSDYYLNKRLPEDAIWHDKQDDGILSKVHRELLRYYSEAHKNYSGKSEPLLKNQLLEPVLKLLGFRVQPVKRGAQRDDLNNIDISVPPDYLLFAGEPTTDEQPLAFCLAYSWGRNLDGKDQKRGGERAEENPGARAVELLAEGRAPWAIVTNGIFWRLYAANAHSRATNYYEIHLLEMLTFKREVRVRAFPYFWLFFRARSFIPQHSTLAGEQRPLSWLDTLLIESEKHARDLGERLKERVFEEIFPHFAQGFVEYARHHGYLPQNLETLPAEERNTLLEPFFNGTLTFLYRLLFLLYAESRDLLPVRQENSYHLVSLEKLKKQVSDDAGTIQENVVRNLSGYSKSKTVLYQHLQRLFLAVDKGDPLMNVPIYNGGLFLSNPPPYQEDEPAEISVARFLQEQAIPDYYLALGLDRMARDLDEKLAKAQQLEGISGPYTHSLIFIDYKSLGVRHLGSIYEGLLEFKLRIAPEEMAVVEGKRTEEVVRYSEAKNDGRKILRARVDGETRERIISKNSVYLENDRRERKATGSYYTPDYIVKYIVEQTVGPLLKQKLDDLRHYFNEALQELEKQRALLKSGKLHKEADPKQETYTRYARLLNEPFFDLKVLDPAMGSGHFLVEVVDYITDHLAKYLNRFHWNPIVHELSLTRSKIEADMQRQGVSIDTHKLTDLNLLKRRVLKSCIYGVDINPMAVELAKVSLWLDCFTLGAPLSFLDHHLKCGNSLLGANVNEVQQDLGRKLFSYETQHMLNAAQLMSKVSKLPDATAQEVAESRTIYLQAYDALKPHKNLFNIWLSQYFGNNKKTQDIAAEHANAIIKDNYSAIKNASDIVAIQTAESIAKSKQFFHWELEFPEVYFDETERKEDAGFDAVVGNPPYDVLASKEREEDLSFMNIFIQSESTYKSVIGRKIDLFRLFIARAINLVRRDGLIGQIVPMSLLADQQALSLRRYLLYNHKFISIDAFPQKDDPKKRIFIEAKLPTCIFIAVNTPTIEKDFVVTTHPGNIIAETSGQYLASTKDIENFDSESLIVPTVKSSQAFLLAQKLSMKPNFVELAKLVQTYQGEINETTMSHLLSDNSTIGPKVLRGGNIQRYTLLNDSRQGINKYINLEQYKTQFKGGKSEHVDKVRIGYQRNAALDNWRRLIFGPLPNPSHCFDSISYLLVEGATSYFYLAVLNSSLLEWRFGLTSSNNHVSTDEIGSLPIRRINFISTPSDRARHLNEAKHLYQQFLASNEPDDLLSFVTHHLTQEPEASDIVHDLLAFLAERMLELNKQRQSLQKDFLTHLESALHIREKDGKAGLEALTGKSALFEYIGDYQKKELKHLEIDELWEILRKNRARIGAGLTPTLKANLDARYQPNLEQLLPLKVALQRTDSLIDQVVYRLYGLSEEEIAVVEGNNT